MRFILNFFQDFISGLFDVLPSQSSGSIGLTTQGKPISIFSIGKGEEKILFLSAMHGNEVGTVRLAHQLIPWLRRHTEYHHRYTFFVIPCLNRDGFHEARVERDYARGGRIGRCNAEAVDLNRNFPVSSFTPRVFWNYGKQYQEKQEVYGGQYGGSEPETKALTQFVLRENIGLIVSFHNAGADVLASRDEKAQALADFYCQASTYRRFDEREWGLLQQTGTLKEWCEEHTISLLEIETAHRYTSDWKRNRRAIWEILDRV